MATIEKDAPTHTEDKGKGSGKVADYLQAPRKKRKSFVLLALGRGTKEDLVSGMEAFVRNTFKNVAVATPRTAEELVKNFSRQIVLLVFDDEFVDLEGGLSMIAELKRKKNQVTIPVLFLTRDPARLIEAYHRHLAVYHETDDYIDQSKAEAVHIYSKIKNGLTANNRRRSRRYQVDVPLEYFRLSDDQMHKGRLLDLSVHGAILKNEDGVGFRMGDQLKLHLRVTTYLPPTSGDYLKLSARVRRVFIDGVQCGISFEHLSEVQLLTLTRYLTDMVNDQMDRRNLAAKAKGSRT